MQKSLSEKSKTRLTPQDVRNILNIDNKEIVSLCKKASVVPKKNSGGQTYFLSEEVSRLKNIMNKSKSKVLAPAVDSNAVVNNLLMQLKSMEQRLSDNVAKVIDEKLDGMDEVVVELIRCKTENETLRQKNNELNNQNYQLKNEISSFKPIGLGLYIKKNTEDFSL